MSELPFSVDFNNFCFNIFLENGSTEFIIRHFDIGLTVLGYCCSFCCLQNAIVHTFLDPYFCLFVTQISFHFIYNARKKTISIFPVSSLMIPFLILNGFPSFSVVGSCCRFYISPVTSTVSYTAHSLLICWILDGFTWKIFLSNLLQFS